MDDAKQAGREVLATIATIGAVVLLLTAIGSTHKWTALWSLLGAFGLGFGALLSALGNRAKVDDQKPERAMPPGTPLASPPAPAGSDAAAVGSALPRAAEVRAVFRTVECPNELCRHLNRSFARFCTRCGRALPTRPAT